jgi:hypothetical protein|tara:strand:- start:1504 stop:2265 length:762 start_codon:yes stop_codon:yes gene_type:complete
MTLYKVTYKGNDFYFKKTPFKKNKFHVNDDINNVLKFTLEMSYGKGKHKNVRTGEKGYRNNLNIFNDVLQGKLAELIIYKKHLPQSIRFKEIDYKCYGLGKWDDGDIPSTDGRLNLNIKSSKFWANLMMLEEKYYDLNGMYKHNNNNNNYQNEIFSFVRINLDFEKIKKFINICIENDKLINEKIPAFINKFTEIFKYFEYDVHFCGRNMVKKTIKEGNILKQGEYIRGVTELKVNNYYIHLIDMHESIDELI